MQQILNGSGIFSVITDEARDCSNQEQMPLIIRYVDEHREIQEMFIACVTSEQVVKKWLCYPGTMATADCTTSTHDEGDCCEEGLHSLSCSEDEDRGELVCTGLIFI